MLKIDAVRFGLAGGIIEGFAIFALTLISHTTGFGLAVLAPLASIFIGYEVSTLGSLIGALYGFMCGFISLFLLAFTYNILGPGNGASDKE